MTALHCCAPHDSVQLPNMHGWWRSWSAILMIQTEIKRGHEKILCGAMCCNVSLMPNACEPGDGQYENGRVKVSFFPISGDVLCSSFLSMQSHLSGFSRVTSMNQRNCVIRFTESYWENLVWNLAGGIITWVNQLIILSSLHKSKQEMSSGRASALFSNLASLCFQCINMESAPIPEVPLKESVLDLMASAFQQQDRKNVHHIAYPSNFASGRLAHFEGWRNSLTYSKAWITLASPVAVVSFQALFLQAKYSSSPWSATPKCLWCSCVDVWFKERQLHPA